MNRANGTPGVVFIRRVQTIPRTRDIRGHISLQSTSWRSTLRIPHPAAQAPCERGAMHPR